MSAGAFAQIVQEASLPGIWSKGVAYARAGSVSEDRSKDPDERVFRIRLTDRPVSPKVTLWIAEEDWFCDCGDRNDPCAHIAAAAIHLKLKEESGIDAPPIGEPASETLPPALASPGPALTAAPRVRYDFRRNHDGLHFDRSLASTAGIEKLRDSLVGWVGGIRSGRIRAPLPLATQDDFAIDALVSQGARGLVPSSLMPKLLEKLSETSLLYLDDREVRASGRALEASAVLEDEPSGDYRIRSTRPDASGSSGGSQPPEIFANGAALAGGVIRPWGGSRLSQREAELLLGDGRVFARSQAPWLVAELIPQLKSKIRLGVTATGLPELVTGPPRIVLELDEESPLRLSVLPRLLYFRSSSEESEPIAEILDQRLELLVADAIPARDLPAEKELIRKLQSELHLRPRGRALFEGERAVEFRLRLRGWDARGRGAKAFDPGEAPLVAKLEGDGLGLRVSFETAAGQESGGASVPRSADSAAVFEAWRENQSFVPLIGGGWAKLPEDWLNRFGERILRLMRARDERGRLPPHALPEMGRLLEETGQFIPVSLQKLRESLETFESIPESPLPHGLKAELRPYQKRGVDWLAFLRENSLGALLADDMGLGKTLQALCAITPKALVVAPTSVLGGWMEQIQGFRPDLRVCLYHGGARKLEPGADIVLTSYGILRMDEALLTGREWETAILDEAQTIRNPASQVARAAHGIRAGFKIALSGTPVENRLEDLWSIFHFLNPGLLGSRQEFQEEYAQPVARGDREARTRLREKTKPFLLRRLKRDVAPELPPRTETTLRCELSAEERDLYQSLLASARREVLDKLEAGGSILHALEALLRLRQSCCHPSLVPGGAAPKEHASSAKTALLLETLENSLASEHRALVFSQWTSYLDLIERELDARGIRYLRLDGTTADRSKVVREFQDPSGPPVFLISLKAGGVGITLTAADHIFLMDPWWNPAVEEQAADRAHRIGQKNPVLVHRLIAEDTVEERILLLQKEKKRLAETVLDPGDEDSSAAGITREDLIALLS